MKPTLLLSALLSCFSLSGNAQDSAAPATPYSLQGNAAQNRSVYENELMSRAQEARRVKELKAAIASQSFGPAPAPITSAEQFMAANRPPTPPPSAQPETESETERPQAYVPDFDTGPSNSATSTPAGSVPSFELPQKQERSFFKWLKGKKEQEPQLNLPEPGSSNYANPYEAPESSDAPSTPAPPAQPAMDQGIPDVPAVNEAPAPIPAPPAPQSTSGSSESGGPAPIFVRRSQPAAAGGETVTVKEDSDAVVKGVMVKLFAGTQVTVLETSGRDAVIRLPDGRVGTIAKKHLPR